MNKFRILMCGAALAATTPVASSQSKPPAKPKPAATAASQGYLGIFLEAGEQGEVLVRELPADGPAAKAGLKVGDRIVEVDGKKIEGAAALQNAVRGKRSGDKVELKILRDGADMKLSATLGERPKASEINLAEETEQPQPEPKARGLGRLRPDGGSWRLLPEGPAGQRRIMLGIQMQQINDDLRKRMSLGSVEGVLITEVVSGSPAAKAGIKADDVVVEVDGSKISDPAELTKLVAAKKAGDKITVKVVRNGKDQAFTVTLEAMAAPIGPRTFRWEFDGSNPPQFKMPEGFDLIPELGLGNRQTVRKLEEQIKSLEAEVKRLTEEQRKMQKQLERLGGAAPKR